MLHRRTPRFLAVVALSSCLAVLALAADKHEGKVVETGKDKLTMTKMDGSNQHSHTVATNAKITRDGKTAKLDDLKKGDVITVTLGEQSGKQVAIEIEGRSSKGSLSIKVNKEGVEVRRNKGDDQDKDRPAKGSQKQAKREAIRASKAIGGIVKNLSDENLGKIEDIVFDPQEGSVNYAVLSFGGFLGVGDKWFAVPWENFKITYENDAKDKFHFVLDVDKERLKNAPGFDKSRFPNLGDPNWAEEVEVYYRASLD